MRVAVLSELVLRIKTAQDECTSLAPITTAHADFDVPAAYAVAHEIHNARLAEGAVPVGRKIGFTNRGIWDEYGVHQPIWGYVYDRTLVRAAGTEVLCAISHYAEPRIEPEIVLHFRSPPPRNGDADAILASIDWIAHGIEIVQSHFPDWKFKVADTIADSALHGTLLLGPPQPVQTLGDHLVERLTGCSVTLSCNGEPRATGSGRNVLGSPLSALAHLVNVLSDQPGYPPLAAGEIVTTGTLTGAYSVRVGDVWSTSFCGIALPGLRVQMIK